MTAIQDLMTQHLDVWTGAVKNKATTGRGSSKKIELTGVKKLRELILELAVRGKLVPQDPNDEPAAVLLEKIAAEKAQLIKDGKIKKQKALPAISDDEKPFDLPEGWEWAQCQTISKYIQRGKGPKYGDAGQVRVISQKCIQWSGFKLEAARFILDETISKYANERFIQWNDLLWNSTGTGTVGRVVVVPNMEEGPLVADSHVTVIRPIFVLSHFLASFITSPIVQRRIEPSHENSLVSGSTKQVELNVSAVQSLSLPIPPLDEQHRIVAKVDELMTLCDQLESQTEQSISAHQTLVEVLLNTLTQSADAADFEQNWQRIANHFDLLFTTEHSIEQLKQTILQLAVMGKLVPQDPNDEPASVLLEKIAAEKARLIAEKKIKRQKALPEITDEEKPYDLPEGWEWARIDNATLYSEYGISAKTFDGIEGIPVLKMGDIQGGKVILGKHKKASFDFDGIDKMMLENEDILYNRTNSAELVGKTGLFIGENNKYSFASYLIRIKASKHLVLPQYLNLTMNTPEFRKTQIVPHLKQQCGQANVNGTIMKNMLIPICPVLEQKRIVTKVNQLTAICDQLLSKIQQSRATQADLAEALVKQGIQ